MFDFPASPTAGQTFTPSGGPTYTWNGYAWALGPGGGLVLNVRVFTASGSYVPSNGLSFALAEAVGGGGGGAGVASASGLCIAGGSGASGGYSRRLLTAAQIGASQAVTIGSAGVGGAAGNNDGTAGGDVSLGALVVAKGGGGGIHSTAAATGAGGAGGPIAGAVGDFFAAGAPGSNGCNAQSSSALISAPSGGSSIFGGGGRGGVAVSGASAAGENASNYGSGGGAAHGFSGTATAVGGNGSPGIVVITEFIGALSAGVGGYVPISGTATINAGYTFTANNVGFVTSGTITPNPALGNYQYYTNNGAHTLAAPATDCAMDILVTNGATAGAITFSGFAGGATGDALTTVNGSKFLISLRRINATALYSVRALQ